MRGSRCIKKFMNIGGFSEPQREAFLDLLVLGMYSDHKLTLAEDASVQSVLDGFRCESDYERNKYLDAATARVREKARSEDSARAYAVGLAQKFKSPEHQRTVYETLERVLASDNAVSARESGLLSVVKEAFQR